MQLRVLGRSLTYMSPRLRPILTIRWLAGHPLIAVRIVWPILVLWTAVADVVCSLQHPVHDAFYCSPVSPTDTKQEC